MRQQELAAIAADLAAEQGALDQLVESLGRERAVLAAGVSDEVERIAAQKEARAAAVVAAGARREARLAAYGVRGGMRALLARVPEGSALAASWRRLLDAARKAKAANDVNGCLIAAHSRYLGARLAALALPDSAATYGPTGASRPPAGGRRLGTI
jgi:flagella synthesis protein FlgN